MVSTGLLQAYAAIGISAVAPIYFGSHASVTLPKHIKRKLRASQSKTREKKQLEEEEDDEDDEIDRLTAQDAWLFPILGSATLLTLFLAFKYLNKDLINLILSSYFAILGMIGFARMSVYIAKGAIPKKEWTSGLEKYRLQLAKGTEELFSLNFTNLHVIATILSLVVSAAHFWTGNWVLSNLLALSFSFNAISLLRLDTFFTGMILLTGLFFYDIYWVFGSVKTFGQSVMVSVATNFEAPIKIVYPKDHWSILAPGSFTMLGLGDIVIPGIFVSLALRFDYHQALQRALKKHDNELEKVPRPGGKYNKPYFYSVLASYILGLTTTIVVMHQFKAAQPALLYLSPACILSVLGTALVRGEIKDVWRWTDEDEQDRQEREQKEKTETAEESEKGDSASHERGDQQVAQPGKQEGTSYLRALNEGADIEAE